MASKTQYVKLTLNEFNAVREEVAASYAQSGAMDEDAFLSAERAAEAIRKAEARNNLAPLYEQGDTHDE